MRPCPTRWGRVYSPACCATRWVTGPTLDKVPNPYLFEAFVYSLGTIAGPIVPYTDFAPVDGWYNGFLKTNVQLGQTPEPAALAPPYGGSVPGWSPQHKLSGLAAIGWGHKFDKKGKRYANGLPHRAAYGKWARVYDPRKDSTFPGGMGPHRLGNEATYEWSDIPALHAGTYAFGRYQNGKRVFGMGLSADAIGFEAIAAWANDCEANNWRMFGVVFEPGDRWANLRDICAAGGGEPIPLYTGIGFHWSRPRVVLDTITEADIGEGDVEVTAMQSYRDRYNTIIPRHLVPSAQWELLPGPPIQHPGYLAEDGEEKSQSWPFNFVKDADQAAELAAYKLLDSREIHPISVPVKPRLMAYRPGDCLHLALPEDGLDTPGVILRRSIDPQTMGIVLTMISESEAKHAYALGLTSEPPPTPTIGQTAQERDSLTYAATTQGSAALRIETRTGGIPLSAAGTEIAIAAFDGVLSDGSAFVFPAGTLTGLAEATSYAVFRDLVTNAYFAELSPATAAFADSDNVFIGWQATPGADGNYPPGETPPPGYGGGSGGDPNTPLQ